MNRALVYELNTIATCYQLRLRVKLSIIHPKKVKKATNPKTAVIPVILASVRYLFG